MARPHDPNWANWRTASSTIRASFHLSRVMSTAFIGALLTAIVYNAQNLESYARHEGPRCCHDGILQ